MATLYFASRHLNHSQCWESIVKKARKGVNQEIAGSQSLYLMNKGSEGFAIIDPNIGLFRCKHDQAKELISKIISSYPLKKGTSSHQILAEQLQSV